MGNFDFRGTEARKWLWGTVAGVECPADVISYGA